MNPQGSTERASSLSPPLPAGLARLNTLAAPEFAAELMKCCGAKRWAKAVAAAKPFATVAALLARAETAMDGLTRADWLEAFSRHPRIGERNPQQAKFAPTAGWSGEEQSGMAGTSGEARRRLEDRNKEYERKFGHVFLICAAGKGADEMLAALEQRMGNIASVELKNAAAEQRQITRLRLERLVNGT